MASYQANYYFRQGRKDSSPGILVIEKKWEFIINRSNKQMTTFWYYCRHRRTKGIQCDAKATVVRMELDGEHKFILKDFTGDHKHPGGMSNAIAEDMKMEMCKMVETNPDKPVSEARNALILENAHKYENDATLWSEIVESLGDYDAIDKRLLRARQKIIGKAPQNRNDFNPTKIIGDSDDIIVLDSNLLPSDWKDKLDNNDGEHIRDWNRNNEVVRTFEETWVEEPVDVLESRDEEEPIEETETESLPKRVLVFTSPKLLKLFENSEGKSSVDGTFKAIPVLWKQLFIWMIKKSGFWIPVCWAWLPDKNLQSYKVFFFLVLEELKRRKIKFNLKEVISDFEINIQKAATEMMIGIVILGCFFHLSKAFWKKVQTKGFAKQFEDLPDFRKFIKSSIALSHLPLEDLEGGVEYLKTMELSDAKCVEFKEEYFIPYIENCWINGPFPPGVWSCFSRSSDLTNNNQKGFNSKINKELKQIYPTFGQRHKIMKELKSFKSPNIVDSLLTSQTPVVLAYNSCEKTFRTPKDLNKHALNNVEVESCPQNVNAWELTSNDITEVQTHTLGHGEEDTRYHE